MLLLPTHPRALGLRLFRVLSLSIVIGAATAVFAAPPPASTDDGSRHTFHITAGPLADALRQFIAQSGLQVLYDPELVRDEVTTRIDGVSTSRAVLDEMLRDSGLTYEFTDSGTVVVKRAPPVAKPARVQSPPKAAAEEAPPPTVLQTVSVTGTRIRGGTTPSPTITIGAQQIQDEGFTDLGEAARSIPQNFSGGQNPGVAAGAARGSPSDQNVTGGSGMNLRGLGPDSTLTLLNGRRMSYGGYAQAVDISAIPVEAVERLEVVPDGASAIYGSDAVGGVANVILKRDFEGVTVGARYGRATEGGLTTREYSATAGTTWATGGLIAAGEKASNDPIYSDQRDYTQSMYRPSTLWQGSDLRSGLFSMHQLLGDAVELRLDALGSERDSHTSMAYPEVYYPYDVKTKATLLAPSIEIWLAGNWTLTLGAVVGDEKNSIVQPAISRMDGPMATSLVALSNRSVSYDAGVEGPLFTLPGGEARLAAGAGYRYNDFLYKDAGNNRIVAKGDESGRFAYAELSLPLVGADQGIGGIERLALTGAARIEDGNYGTVTTPKVGVIYSPNADFSFRASWGRSFKAPTLIQRHFAQNAIYYPASHFGPGYAADATALWLSGGNPDLKPERARTSSATLAFHPKNLTGFEAELTWFDVDYTERVLQPITGGAVFGNPVYADFVYYDPSSAALDQALANASNFYNYVGEPFDATKVVAVVDGRYVNASRQRIGGIDLSGSYRVDMGPGRLTIRGSASWLHGTQALTAAQDAFDVAGMLFHPARTSVRFGALWNQGSFTASVFANYKSGVTDPADGRDGASFTTFDGTLRFETGADAGAAANMVFELTGRNLLNRAPPSFIATSLTYAPYDSTNYSAVGRYLSVSVSKHF